MELIICAKNKADVNKLIHCFKQHTNQRFLIYECDKEPRLIEIQEQEEDDASKVDTEFDEGGQPQERISNMG